MGYSVLVAFVFPLLSAFLAFETIPYLKYRIKSVDKHKHMLWLLLFGFVLYSFCAYLLEIVIKSAELNFFSKLVLSNLFWLDPVSRLGNFLLLPFDGAFQEQVHFDVASVMTFIMSLLLVLYMRSQIKRYKNSCAKQRILASEISLSENPDSLEQLYNYSIDNFAPIMLNLKNRKVYIGFVESINCVFHPKDREFINIFPLYSGYRTDDTLKFVKDNDYGFLIAEGYISSLESLSDVVQIDEKVVVNKDDLHSALEHSVVIRTSEIVSAVAWLDEIYQVVSKATKIKPTNNPNTTLVKSILKKLLDN